MKHGSVLSHYNVYILRIFTTIFSAYNRQKDKNTTSFPGSLILPPPGASEERHEIISLLNNLLEKMETNMADLIS